MATQGWVITLLARRARPGIRWSRSKIEENLMSERSSAKIWKQDDLIASGSLRVNKTYELDEVERTTVFYSESVETLDQSVLLPWPKKIHVWWSSASPI